MLYWILPCLAVVAAAPGSVRRIEPPEGGFYSKRLDYKGIPIKASEAVSDRALVAGRERLDRMLHRLPTVVWNLKQAGVELHIIGKDQVTSDLPENREWKGKPYDGKLTIDERTRGVGGRLVSCGEENLLHLPGDRYAGRDICIHEFTHAIFEFGISRDLRQRIDAQYRTSLDKGLWHDAYASVNPNEFMAELTMWYFGTHGDRAKLANAPADGPGALRAYDPDACELLDDLYSGRLRIPRVRARRQESTPTAPNPARGVWE